MLSHMPIITSTDSRGHLQLGSVRANSPTGLHYLVSQSVHSGPSSLLLKPL